MLSSLAAMILLCGNKPSKPKVIPNERMTELQQWQEQVKHNEKQRAEFLKKKFVQKDGK
jgi:hypothetical protein